jgi:hypothetical protein
MTSKLRPGRKYTSSGLRGMGRVQRAIWRALVASNGRPLSTRELAAWAWPRLTGELQNKHLSSICHAAARVAARAHRAWRGRFSKTKGGRYWVSRDL